MDIPGIVSIRPYHVLNAAHVMLGCFFFFFVARDGGPSGPHINKLFLVIGQNIKLFKTSVKGNG